jgi:hypothetical protein
MIAVTGHTYAQVVSGLVFWIFTSAQLPEWADGQIAVADITGVSPAPAAGWTATNSAGNWSFAAPAAPPAPGPAQLAVTALSAGLALTSTGTPALNATYALDPESRADMLAEMVSLLANSTFTNGTTSLAWPDAANTMHTFNVTEFKAFATAAGAYVGALKPIIASNTGTLPSAGATIA